MYQLCTWTATFTGMAVLLRTELMWEDVHARMAYGQLQNRNWRKMRGCERREVYYWYFGHETVQSYLLTYSMVPSPSWEANWFAASQEIPRISWNPKVHYRTHKRPPPVPILGQPNPVPIPTSHLLEIHPNIIHPSTPRSPQWSPSLRFPHQDPETVQSGRIKIIMHEILFLPFVLCGCRIWPVTWGE